MRIRIGTGIWILIGVLILVVVAILGVFLIVIPQSKKVGDVKEEINGVEANIQQETNRLNQLKQYEKDPQQFQRQVDVLKERIPERVELADVIQQIDHAAEEAGLDFYTFTPQMPVMSENYYVVTINTLFRGRYFNLIEFFNHMERLPRTIKVVLLDVQASDEGLPYLQAKILLRVFFTTSQGVEKLVGGGAK